MTGSGIFSTESQDNAAEYGSPGSRPCQVLFQNERKIGYTLFSLVCRTFGFQNDLILMLAQNARLIFFFFFSPVNKHFNLFMSFNTTSAMPSCLYIGYIVIDDDSKTDYNLIDF